MGALRGVSAGVRGSRQVSSVTWPIYVILVFSRLSSPVTVTCFIAFFSLVLPSSFTVTRCVAVSDQAPC